MNKFWLWLSYYGTGALIYVAYSVGREREIVRIISALAFIFLGYYRRSIEVKLLGKV